jgi:hypothetical protein
VIERPRLLADLQRLLKTLEADLRDRCSTRPEVDAPVREEYERARSAGRTAQAYEIWREDHLTQAGVAWILACVFVRFLEDNGLADTPRLAGPGDRLALAREHHTAYISRHPTETDREYLLSVFRETARLPAMAALLNERHDPLFRLGLSADGARTLLGFWQKIDPATGALVHDFTDPTWNTRFLGDLYQDLSESARKTYALLQTPEFVEEFILDRTLEPAIQEFGYQAVRLIDPACGSGHFLLGAFRRLFERWLRDEPGTNARALAQRTLDALHGVDLNPFAAAIARFRLLVAALEACGVKRLAEAPGLRISVAVGDSLLHGSRPTRVGRGVQRDLLDEPLRHVYETEDADELRRILGQRYHLVVGNPPYITPKDAALNQAYRDRFGSCHMKYSLAVPFMERFFDLAAEDGVVGMITANSFMKREFGRKLIEEFIPRWDLTHVVDTSGAYIPGHGTPTVILFGRNRSPVASAVRAVLGIRGEPQTPDNAAKGLVWSSIVTQIDRPGSQSEFVSVGNMSRARFSTHPWSIGGGGAADLKKSLEDVAVARLGDSAVSIGVVAVTAEDDAFLSSVAAFRRGGLPEHSLIAFVEGSVIRDWVIVGPAVAIFPYDRSTLKATPPEGSVKYLWPYRAGLRKRLLFRQTQERRGLAWFEYAMFVREKFSVPLSIAFAFVATHNHFAIDRGPKVFKQTAPVIKLPADASEDDHLGLLGLLNSSTACFWMKQTFSHKGVGGIGGGIGDEAWEPRYEFDSTKLWQYPVAASYPLRTACHLDRTASHIVSIQPASIASEGPLTRNRLNQARTLAAALREQMISLQEELDWQCYSLYGLSEHDLSYPREDLPRVKFGERAFEIVLARGMATGELATAWFERHGSTPITEIPAQWPEDYRKLVERRIEAIGTNPSIAIIEQAEYKRRWNAESWEEQEERALCGWLLDRLEDARYWPEPRLTSCGRLADRVREDADFMQVAELYRGRADFDVTRLVTELAEEESVPFLPVLRYTASGMQRRAAWEECWALQRREDGGEKVAEIAVPPRYGSGDFRKSAYWRLSGQARRAQGALHPVPARRARCRPDAGARLGRVGRPPAGPGPGRLLHRHEGVGSLAPRPPGPAPGRPARPLALLRQWHNEVDPETRLRMGDYFAQFLDEEARALGLSLDDLRRWSPPAGSPRRAARRRP